VGGHAKAAQGGLAKFARDVFPTAEEDAGFEADYARALAHQMATERRRRRRALPFKAGF